MPSRRSRARICRSAASRAFCRGGRVGNGVRAVSASQPALFRIPKSAKQKNPREFPSADLVELWLVFFVQHVGIVLIQVGHRTVITGVAEGERQRETLDQMNFESRRETALPAVNARCDLPLPARQATSCMQLRAAARALWLRSVLSPFLSSASWTDFSMPSPKSSSPSSSSSSTALSCTRRLSSSPSSSKGSIQATRREREGRQSG